jgi:type I restriction enzyme R subunit
MIGRGTRLCPGVFGIPENERDKSKDKSEFLIFDYCGNFEFFDVNPDGLETKMPKSMAQRIMETRLRIVMALWKQPELLDEETLSFRNGILDMLHKTVLQFNRNSFIVKAVLREVDIFSVRERWNSLSSGDIAILFNKLTPLAEPDDADEDARRFDLLILNLMLAILEATPDVYAYASKVKAISNSLLKKTNLPVVRLKETWLRNISSDTFWKESLSVTTLEHTRVEIRELIRLLDQEKRRIVYSNFTDEITGSVVSEAMSTYVISENYKQRVERYVRENYSHQIIQKLRKNIPITHAELSELEKLLFDGKECGTKDDFVQSYGEQPLGQFIRSIVGLEVNAAKEAFSEFLNAGNLSADQIRFVDMIIDYLSTNGIIDVDMLFEEPFTTFHTEGIAGLFDEKGITKLLSILHRIDANAAA